MLNTATWSTRTPVQSVALSAPDLIEDFDVTDSLPIAHAVGITQSSMPEKPYVRGQHAKAADRMRQFWNQMNPNDPMP